MLAVPPSLLYPLVRDGRSCPQVAGCYPLRFRALEPCAKWVRGVLHVERHDMAHFQILWAMAMPWGQGGWECEVHKCAHIKVVAKFETGIYLPRTRQGW